MFIYCYLANNITDTVGRIVRFPPQNQDLTKDICFLQYDTITTSIYFSNFIEYDSKASRAMLLLMEMTGIRQMKIEAVGFIRLELSLEMFVKVTRHFFQLVHCSSGKLKSCFISQITKATFSIIAVLRSIQNQRMVLGGGQGGRARGGRGSRRFTRGGGVVPPN